MACEDKDLAEIWAAITDLRKANAETMTALARIEEQLRGIKDLLSERCETRLATLNTIQSRQEAHATKIETIERKQSFTDGRSSVVAAVVAGVITLMAAYWKK